MLCKMAPFYKACPASFGTKKKDLFSVNSSEMDLHTKDEFKKLF